VDILIVDDSSAMRMIVRRTLRKAGFGGHNISDVDSAVKALDVIRESPPDLILSDWNMPEMSGIELLDTLREEGREIDFGFITTEATPEMRAKAGNAGAQFLIAKPFTEDTFAKTLQPFLA